MLEKILLRNTISSGEVIYTLTMMASLPLSLVSNKGILLHSSCATVVRAMYWKQLLCNMNFVVANQLSPTDLA